MSKHRVNKGTIDCQILYLIEVIDGCSHVPHILWEQSQEVFPLWLRHLKKSRLKKISAPERKLIRNVSLTSSGC